MMTLAHWSTAALCVACVAVSLAVAFVLGHLYANRRWCNVLRDLNDLDDGAILSLVRMWGPNGRYGRKKRWPGP